MDHITWANALKSAVIFAPLGGVLILFIRSWMNQISKDLSEKTPRTELAIHVEHFKEELKELNGDVKRSFDKICEKLDEQAKGNIELVKEMTKIGQRVDDLVKNGVDK